MYKKVNIPEARIFHDLLPYLLESLKFSHNVHLNYNVQEFLKTESRHSDGLWFSAA